jgi:hypothetical protein
VSRREYADTSFRNLALLWDFSGIRFFEYVGLSDASRARFGSPLSLVSVDAEVSRFLGGGVPRSIDEYL